MSQQKNEDIEEIIARYIGIVIETMKDEFKVGLEAIDMIKVQVAKIPAMEAHLAELTSDMKAVKAVLKITSQDLKGHDKRITKLERAVFDA